MVTELQDSHSSALLGLADGSVILHSFNLRSKGLCRDQKRLHLFLDSEAYHDQMGPIPSSNGSLDIALSNTHT